MLLMMMMMMTLQRVPGGDFSATDLHRTEIEQRASEPAVNGRSHSIPTDRSLCDSLDAIDPSPTLFVCLFVCRTTRTSISICHRQ
uniref:Putative secreted protein n=1 Tax=Anopheles darlingi TaxID=43151 RepID=A0A2M4DHW2_ANODA